MRRLNNNHSGFGAIGIILAILVFGIVAFAGAYVIQNSKSASVVAPKSAQTGAKISTTESVAASSLKSLSPFNGFKVQYDKSWKSQYKENSEEQFLSKTVSGKTYRVSFKYLGATDYLNRSTGGAYPPGTLYKQITANDQAAYIGMSVNGTGYVSTCPISDAGGCAIHLKNKHSDYYILAELDQLVPGNDVYPNTKLDFSTQADKQMLDEFSVIASTISF